MVYEDALSVPLSIICCRSPCLSRKIRYCLVNDSVLLGSKKRAASPNCSLALFNVGSNHGDTPVRKLLMVEGFRVRNKKEIQGQRAFLYNKHLTEPAVQNQEKEPGQLHLIFFLRLNLYVLKEVTSLFARCIKNSYRFFIVFPE